MILISLAFFISACDDKSYIKTIYNKEQLNKNISCLKLKLSLYSNKVYEEIKTLYKFNDTCDNSLRISYKTNIGCNSKYNTNKSLNSYIQLELLYKNKKVYSVYKDLKDANISKEIKKGYNVLCKKIKI